MNRSNGISYCVYPCPCGYYGDPTKECTCAPSMVTRYQKRASEAGPLGQRPLLDRIDIHVGNENHFENRWNIVGTDGSCLVLARHQCLARKHDDGPNPMGNLRCLGNIGRHWIIRICQSAQSSPTRRLNHVNDQRGLHP
jgi:hypothetical protein